MAEEHDDSAKTEDPSSRKLDEAREKGQVVHSREVVNWFAMLAIGGTVMLLAPPMAKSLALALVRFLEEPHRLRLEDAFATGILDSLGAVALALLAPLGLALVAGVGASVLQTGVLIAP